MHHADLTGQHSIEFKSAPVARVPRNLNSVEMTVNLKYPDTKTLFFRYLYVPETIEWGVSRPGRLPSLSENSENGAKLA